MTPKPQSVNSAALELCKIEGVLGLLLQEEGHVIFSEMPVPASQCDRLSDLVRAMCSGYRRVRRVLRQLIIGYDCGILLVLSRDDAQLVLLLAEDANVDLVAEQAAKSIMHLFQRPIRLPKAAA